MADTVPMVLNDDSVRAHLNADVAIRWIEEALLAKAQGRLSSPSRVSADLVGGRLVFTAGAIEGQWYGYRAYDTFAAAEDEQVVVAHDALTGRVVAVAVGSEVGLRRTGALGAVAVKHLTRGSVGTVGVIGAGPQAWAQVWALTGFATPGSVRVFARTPAARMTLAERFRAELGVSAEPRPDARAAVTGADLVILATSSPTPVLKTNWLERDVTVVTVGPKQVGKAEFPADLVTGADFVVTDSPAQLATYNPPALVAGRVQARDLARLVAGEVEAPIAGRRVYCSVGLAGTEVYLLGKLANLLTNAT